MAKNALEEVRIAEELATISNSLSFEALLRILIRKGLVTETDMSEELDLVHADHMAKLRSPLA